MLAPLGDESSIFIVAVDPVGNLVEYLQQAKARMICPVLI